MSKIDFLYSIVGKNELEALLAASKENNIIAELLAETDKFLLARPELLMTDPTFELNLIISDREESRVFYATERVIYTSLKDAMAGEADHFES